jgi:hypothetical protein
MAQKRSDRSAGLEKFGDVLKLGKRWMGRKQLGAMGVMRVMRVMGRPDNEFNGAAIVIHWPHCSHCSHYSHAVFPMAASEFPYSHMDQ